MIGKANHVLCAAFQAHLPELIDTGAADLAGYLHFRNCANCRALIVDLETIAEAARQLFPPQEPSKRLWKQIETAIEHEKTAHSVH